MSPITCTGTLGSRELERDKQMVSLKSVRVILCLHMFAIGVCNFIVTAKALPNSLETMV